MFGNKKNDSFSGNEKQNAPGSGDKEKKFTGSLEKIEGKKEKLSKLLKRKKKDEEPVSLYEPEMEYVTAEELQKEEKERVNAAEQKEGGGTDSGRQDGAQTTGGKEQKIGKDSGVRTRFKNLFSKKDEAAQKTGTAGPQSTLFDDEPILYDIDDEKGLRKLSKKKLAVIAGAVVIVLGAASYFIFTNLGGSVDGTAYVESVKDIMSYGSGSGDKGTPIVLVQNYFNNYAN